MLFLHSTLTLHAHQNKVGELEQKTQSCYDIHFITVVLLIHNNKKKVKLSQLSSIFQSPSSCPTSPHCTRVTSPSKPLHFQLQKEHKQLYQIKFHHRLIVSTNLCSLHQSVKKPKMKIISSHLIPTHIKKLNPKPMDPQSSLNTQFTNAENQCDSITLHSSYSKHVKTLTQV